MNEEPLRRPRRIRTRAEPNGDGSTLARQVMQLRGELIRTRADRDEALLQLKEIRAKLTEANFKSLENENGELVLSIEPSREWMLIVAEHLRKLLDADAGSNYVQWDIKPRGQVKPYRLILVRPEGKSPHELRQEAEAEVARLQAELAAGDYHTKRIVEAAEAWVLEPFGSNNLMQLTGDLADAVKAKYEA